MAETPSCTDSQRDLLKKILLQFVSMGTNVPANLLPLCNDGQEDLYRKILLSLAFIT